MKIWKECTEVNIFLMKIQRMNVIVQWHNLNLPTQEDASLAGLVLFNICDCCFSLKKCKNYFQDEPAIKSRFDITLTIPQNRLGLSNMPIVSEEILDDNSKLIRLMRAFIGKYFIFIMYYNLFQICFIANYVNILYVLLFHFKF